MGSTLLVRVLGPVDVLIDTVPRPISGLRRKAVLAVLALHQGGIASTDRLIDAVWGGTAPTTSVNTLQRHVSYLRQVLGDKTAILASPPGYLLNLGAEATDLATAQRLIEQGNRCTDPEQGASALRAALAMWRDRPLVDVAGLAWLDEQAEHLDQLRWHTEQSLISVRLALGEHAQLVPELERLIVTHPFDEQLHGQLILALYRTGRQADALGAYRRIRDALQDELGIDPHQGLRGLEAAILRQDTSLQAIPPPGIIALPAFSPSMSARVRDPAPEPVTDATSPRSSGARALITNGDLRNSWQWFETAYRHAEQAGDLTAMANAALGLGGLWIHEYHSTAVHELIVARVRQVPAAIDQRSPLALRLPARPNAETDDRRGDDTMILAALDLPGREPNPTARVEALNLAHHCLLGPDHATQRQELAAELRNHSVHTGRRTDHVVWLLWQTVDQFLNGDPHAEHRLSELRDQLSRRDHVSVGFVVCAMEVMLAIRAGRLGTAEAMAHACADRGAAAGDFDATGWLVAQLVAIRRYQGRIAETLPMLKALAYAPIPTAVSNSYVAALAVAAATTGERHAAATALATLRERDLDNLARSGVWVVTMSAIAEAAFLLGDGETAKHAYHLLSPAADLPAMASLGVVCFGSVQHSLGLAASAIGDLDLAIEHLDAAVGRNLALPHKPAVIESRRQLALALTQRAQPHDTITAQRQLTTAAEEAAALGLTLTH